MVYNPRLLVYFHLLWTAVLAGLALLLSIRFPYAETTRWFRITLALLVLTAVAVLPLLAAESYSLLWLPASTFIAATAAFTVFSVKVIRAHLDRLRR